MNFHPTKKKKTNKLKITGGIVFLVLFLEIIAPRTTSKFFITLFAPLWRVEQSIQSSGFFHSRTSLETENAQLKTEIETRAASDASISYLEKENAELKTLLGRPSIKNATLATVLSKPPFTAYDTLILDIGLDQHIDPGALVYVPNTLILASGTSTTSEGTSSNVSATSTEIHIPKIAIGTVSDVFSSTARVELFSTPGKKYDVEVGNKHIKESATARGGGIFEIIIPRDAGIAVGDAITIPSIEPIMFGSVGSIISDPARAYATVLFTLPVNPFELHFVLVGGQVPTSSKGTIK
jgi:cell shape-determining protein MreC